MKPTLLMNVGTSFSASSPLHYTLGWDNKYCHTGHTKEHQYLYITQVGKKAWGRRYAAKKREKRRREEIEQGGFTSKPDVLTGESPLIKNNFDWDVLNRFYKGDYDIDDPEIRWVDDRIKYWQTDDRILTKNEMLTANLYWKTYGGPHNVVKNG